MILIQLPFAILSLILGITKVAILFVAYLSAIPYVILCSLMGYDVKIDFEKRKPKHQRNLQKLDEHFKRIINNKHNKKLN